MRQIQDDVDALLAKYVDLPIPELGLICSNCQEGLHWIIRYLGNLRVDSEVGDLCLNENQSLRELAEGVKCRSSNRANCVISGCKWGPVHTLSSTKRSGPKPAERSVGMPACLPRRR